MTKQTTFDEFVRVRLTARQKEAFIRKAKRLKMRPSDVLRDLIGAFADGRITVTEE